jgi:hypothetical protein
MEFSATTTRLQDKAVAILERKGYRVTRVTTFDGDEAPTVFLARRHGSATHLCQIEPDASVHGHEEMPD